MHLREPLTLELPEVSGGPFASHHRGREALLILRLNSVGYLSSGCLSWQRGREGTHNL